MLTPWSVTADAPARPVHPTSVRTLGTLACFASLLLLLFGRRGLELGGQWAADETYSHGFLVPLVSLFLAGRELARGWSGSGSTLGLVWVVLGCGARLAAAIVWFPPLDFVSLACLLHGLALLVGGSDLARRLRFPILFLFFACPLPAFLLDGLSVALQGLVASLAEGVLYQFVPVYREGYVLRLPGVVLEVGAACSGLRGRGRSRSC
jgi:exosortase